ncbi:MAG: N-acetyl-alpha-D-glucosaminyl L-malate synthase BshA [Acidobacteria bacterium]|nr:MAG: N-acetyl-alpha-D-glucosaminyl L-malate synthase BshA [Acidobacteriota bacterium]REK07424.1 MAG: N-acetyl-alpha-D-glucosaminyl L-malate synthase BshA [Acidobacteriota bacterium]
MRIGVSCYPTYGGSGVVASELAIALQERGHDVHVISYARPPRLSEEDGQGLTFHPVQVRHYPLFEYPPYSLALATKMVEVARRHQLDLMHVHYAVPNAVSALLAQQILQPQRLAVVTTLHGTDVTLVGKDPSYLETTRWGVEQSDRVTAVSGWLRERTQEQLGTRRAIEVISNFVDTERFRPFDPALDSRPLGLPCGPELSGDRPIVLHISNYRRVKRVEDVLAIYRAARHRAECRLVMVGDGPGRADAEERCRDEEIPDVHFVDEHPHVEQLVRRAAVFLLTSSQESFGLAALEAMASGVAVVATRVGGVPEVVDHGESGLLYPLGDVEGMAAGVVSLLRDPRRRAELGSRGRAVASERFARSAVVASYERLYRSVVADEPAAEALQEPAPDAAPADPLRAG